MHIKFSQRIISIKIQFPMKERDEIIELHYLTNRIFDMGNTIYGDITETYNDLRNYFSINILQLKCSFYLT